MDYFFWIDFVIVEVIVVVGKEVRLMEYFQVVVECMVSYGKNIKIQIIVQILLYYWYVVCELYYFGNVFIVGLNIGQIRDFIIDLIKQFGFQFLFEFMSDGWKVDYCIGVVINSSMDFDSIFKCCRSQDFMGGDIFFCQIQCLVVCGFGNVVNFCQG